MDTIDNDINYKQASFKVKKIKKFYKNLLTYLVTIVFLAAINYVNNGWHNPWFLWAALGWGIGIMFNGIKAFDWNPFLNKDWEKRKLEQLMKEDKTMKSSTKKQWE